MEILLQTVIIVFMLFLCTLCLFAVMVIARDMIAECSAKRKKDEPCSCDEKKEQIVKEITVIKEVPVEKESVNENAKPAEDSLIITKEAEEEPTKSISLVLDDENSVKFSTTKHTLETKYAMLSKERKSYFDSIAKHALSKAGAKANVSRNYHDYKIGASRLLRMSIKRGEIVCEFVFINRNFKDYASKADLKFKPSSTVIRVAEPSAVGVAKDGIDLVYNQILEEKEFKKQEAREKRKARRQSQSSSRSMKEEETANV